MNTNPFNGPQESLPLFVYRNIKKPDVSAVYRGFAGALVLMGLVVVLFAAARFIGRDRSKSRKRKARRAAVLRFPPRARSRRMTEVVAEPVVQSRPPASLPN